MLRGGRGSGAMINHPSPPRCSSPPAVSAISVVSPIPSVTERLVRDLTVTIDSLSNFARQHAFTLDQALTVTKNLLCLRHTIIDNPHSLEAKDAFRRQNGFQALRDLARRLADWYDPHTGSTEDRTRLLTLFKDVLAVLAECLRAHVGNRRYFARRMPTGSGGISSLEETFRTLTGKLEGHAATLTDTQQWYGGLLAAALCQESVANVFTALVAKFPLDQSSISAAEMRAAVDQALGIAETIEVPELLGPFLRVWLGQSTLGMNHQVQRLALPACLCRLAAHSRRNLVALHATGMLSAIVPILFSKERTDAERALYRQLAEYLCSEGVPSLDVALDLYRRAYNCSSALQFLLMAMRSSKRPSSIGFDMRSHGYASVELSALSRSFPPIASAGYTITVWAQFDHFDPSAHTTIFGAFDVTQTCFVLAYLEKDTRNLIFQTSINGPRPSVRFKSVVFEPGRWYHLCVMHKKARATASARASLFVDGEFAEQLRIEYPNVPATRSSNKLPKVQAFFGTPQDLAIRLGKGISSSRWSLANAMLFEDTFSDDMVAVFYHLGPRYYGNYQDGLGSFQTYQASAALNLRNESLHPGKEERSDIVTAIRQRASTLVSESNILINLSPTSVITDDLDDGTTLGESVLVKSLSKPAIKNLQQLTQARGNAVAINGAIPAINDALTRTHGVAILTGDTAVSVPQSLDDVSWRIGGGAAVHLSMIQAASTAESTLLAVETLFEAVQDNWRNSEAMERDNGYSILALLLREKLSLPQGPTGGSFRTLAICADNNERSALAIDLLRLILEFVGYNFRNPNQSIITNPLAYRVLLVDLDFWRFGELSLLQMYYSQFSTFATDSQHRRFNAKRLSRMRVNKKLLDALKGDDSTEESLSLLVPAFRSLLDSCATADLLRSLALFVTYAIHDARPHKLQRKKSILFDARSRHLPTSKEQPQTGLTKPKIGIEILRMYTSFLCSPDDTTAIKKFARAVTNKWLLYLMCEDEPEVVVLASKILARLIVVHGNHYSKKLSEKTGGYTIMQHRLKRWWNIPILWPICFSVFFGIDVSYLELDRPFDHFAFVELFLSKGDINIVFPEIFLVISEMLQSGLKKAVAATEDQTSRSSSQSSRQELSVGSHYHKPSMLSSSPSEFLLSESTFNADVSILATVIGFLAELHAKSQAFQDFAATSTYTQQLLFALFPVVVGSDRVSAEVELNSRNSALSFDANNVVIHPLSSAPPVLRTTTVEPSDVQDGSRGSLRRGSSFILISSDKAKYSPSAAHLRHISIPRVAGNESLASHSLVQGLLELVISVFSDQLLIRKDFSGLGTSFKTPPGFLEHQTYFESWLLRNTISTLENHILLNQKLLLEPRVLTNLARFLMQMGEALYEGRFIDGVNATFDFAGVILEYLQRPDISSLKSIRLCSQAINTMRSVLFRIALFKLSQVTDAESRLFLDRLAYWQAVLLSAGGTHLEYLKLLCYLLYTKLVTEKDDVRLAAANLWRIILVQKPSEMTATLSHAVASLQRRLSGGFEKLVGMDDEAFLRCVDDQRDDLDAFFFGTISKLWETFVQDENSKMEESTKARISKRKEKLKQWDQDEKAGEEVIRKHNVTFDHWTSNIFASESLRHQRVIQDQQDNSSFMWSAFSCLSQDLHRFGGLLAENKEKKWRLDQTEGRSRMRLRVIPDDSGERQDYQPKRKVSEAPPALRIDAPEVRAIPSTENLKLASMVESTDNGSQVAGPEEKNAIEESFEMIDDPKVDLDDYEDKNRKVMRSLHRGDQVQNVCNMSRVVGLEACEGLLILGKDCIYILDNFFQRADGEIVNVWQAPPEERDPYVRMIAGRESVNERRSREHGTRSWKWPDVISVSKRRFLFRDVALELFFTDGRSYLLTLISSRVRDELFGQLSARAPHISGGHMSLSRSEDIWRFDSLRAQDDAPQSLGSKFASVFGQSPSNPATRKWVKGEMSNFHYLMLINTLAGRTFNDLTQYPVFPWVLADYSSEELDLSDPKSFRDLSKPMGCQTLEREGDFRERYKSLAEMGDQNAPPFHFGTHYSSAMIVSSYLIRLQPFVKSYLLLQGGTFDHADRLFYSVGKAWESASRGNMSDVRELIPEFFYLPEFLVNSNKYDFGLRQNVTQSIDLVELPPWAHGDPKIFIMKHREALESPYITANLHHWIDLVFGFKQKGEAAVEAVNVFHHLSYQGAKDLDNIDDPVERLATIGIIHNFGQTPYQIFHRPHPKRDDSHRRKCGLSSLAESLTRTPILLLDSHERVSSLTMKQDRLLCTGVFRLNVPPSYDRYLEWGFSDGSIRFYAAESKKLLGHFEHLHVGQLSCVLFADSRTLITSGSDCTISVWSFTSTNKSVELQPQSCLFGHRHPVTVLAVSRSFSVILSASTDGQIMLWDLNRQCFVRELPAGGPVECARINDATGTIMVCRGSRISLYSLNGALLLNQAACEMADDRIVSCAFYEGAGNEWLERELVFTGHRRGVVNVWSKSIRKGRFELDLIRQLHHIDCSHDNGVNISAAISCILPLPLIVYTGDGGGRVYEWNCILRP